MCRGANVNWNRRLIENGEYKINGVCVCVCGYWIGTGANENYCKCQIVSLHHLYTKYDGLHIKMFFSLFIHRSFQICNWQTKCNWFSFLSFRKMKSLTSKYGFINVIKHGDAVVNIHSYYFAMIIFYFCCCWVILKLFLNSLSIFPFIF